MALSRSQLHLRTVIEVLWYSFEYILCILYIKYQKTAIFSHDLGKNFEMRIKNALLSLFPTRLRGDILHRAPIMDFHNGGNSHYVTQLWFSIAMQDYVSFACEYLRA